jgi:transposase
MEKVTLPKRRYTAEFRLEAVKLVHEAGLSQAEAARRLGLSLQTLATWCQDARKGQLARMSGQKVSPEQHELSRLRRENAELRLERDILRKAAAYFAKESK